MTLRLWCLRLCTIHTPRPPQQQLHWRCCRMTTAAVASLVSSTPPIALFAKQMIMSTLAVPTTTTFRNHRHHHNHHRMLTTTTTTVRGGHGDHTTNYHHHHHSSSAAATTKRLRALLHLKNEEASSSGSSTAQMTKGSIKRLVEYYPTFLPNEQREVLLRYVVAEEGFGHASSKDFFDAVLKQPDGMQFLTHVRRDLLHLISSNQKQPHQLHPPASSTDYLLLHFKSALRHTLTEQLFPSEQQQQQQLTCRLLQQEELAADVLATAAVHRFTEDVQKQLFGPTKRVYGLFHPKLHHPVVILFVSLQPCIPASLSEIYADPGPADPPRLPVATFYSIANLQPGLAGLGLGERLIHLAVQHLQQQQQQQQQEQEQNTESSASSSSSSSLIDTFVTLSPMPGFRMWLSNQVVRLDDAQHSAKIFGESADNDRDFLFLSSEWNCPPNQVLQQMLDKLAARDDFHGGDDHPMTLETAAVKRILARAAAYYIVHAKMTADATPPPPHGSHHHHQPPPPQQPSPLNPKPIDGVARFHLQNGATVYRINALKADPSAAGWRHSFGGMVNYQYHDRIRLAQNQVEYKARHTVAVHDNVAQLLRRS